MLVIGNPIEEYNILTTYLSELIIILSLPPTSMNFRTPQRRLWRIYFCLSPEGSLSERLCSWQIECPGNLTQKEAVLLAEKLFFVMNLVSVEWGSIPDRPDGQIDIQAAANEAIAGNLDRHEASALKCLRPHCTCA
jgi:hypothetical protein